MIWTSLDECFREHRPAFVTDAPRWVSTSKVCRAFNKLGGILVYACSLLASYLSKALLQPHSYADAVYRFTIVILKTPPRLLGVLLKKN